MKKILRKKKRDAKRFRAQSKKDFVSILNKLGTMPFITNPDNLEKTLSKNKLITRKQRKILSSAKRLHLYGPEHKPFGLEDFSKKKKAYVEQLNNRLLKDATYLKDLGFNLSFIEAKQAA